MSKIVLESDTGAKFGINPEGGLSADKEIVPANINGDASQQFKIADAVNGDEAVSKNQLLAHYPTLTYVEYTTGASVMTISQPAASTWFDLPNVAITIPKDGIYSVTYDTRMWQDISTNYFWRMHRILKNGTEITKSIMIGFNKNVANLDTDGTFSKTFIDSFASGDVLQVQGYWGSYTSGNTGYSGTNGGTSIVAIKIG